MKKITITGGSGFIGTNLIKFLLEQGHTIQNIDTSHPVIERHKPYWQSVDILDVKSLTESITAFSPNIIIHLAAVTDLDGTTPEYYSANTDGTQNIIDVANTLPHLERVVFTSSMYVCKPGYIPNDYEDYKPHTLYGESKVEGEKLVKAIQRARYGWTIIRPTSIWGPWFKIPYIDFFKVVYQGKYFDFGKACTKTYGFVENAVFQINGLLIADAAQGQTFYIGDKPPIQISEWANEISIVMKKGPIKSVPYPLLKVAALGGDVLLKLKVKFPITSFRLGNMTTNNILPVDNLYEIVGKPPVSRAEGVKKTIDWLVKERDYVI
ncbi:MAG TPA: NAD(P)-dependent oxidoreductase [Leeuwenhoekiella sp.]|nr:NAD(P)-dependent oxidoreductase [Leeuwenhoekiella sp.]